MVVSAVVPGWTTYISAQMMSACVPPLAAFYGSSTKAALRRANCSNLMWTSLSEQLSDLFSRYSEAFLIVAGDFSARSGADYIHGLSATGRLLED